VFQGRAQGYRNGPTGQSDRVAALEAKVTEMEDGIATVCFATGMARSAPRCFHCCATATTSSRVVPFGNTVSLFGTLPRMGRRLRCRRDRGNERRARAQASTRLVPRRCESGHAGDRANRQTLRRSRHPLHRR
jgi:O-acetylhomoserine/O-acetylserine sulfhydrylase-like pyridoxal-dependent enzyme